MTTSHERLHRNVRGGLRTALGLLSKAAVGPLTTFGFTKVSATTGSILRTAGGSFLDDNVTGGDELTTSGFASLGLNGVWIVDQISDTQLDVHVPEGITRTLVSEGAGAPVSLSVGAPRFLKEDGWRGAPVPGEPWIRESYKGGPERRRNIGSPVSVRLDFLCIYSVFYPAGWGSDGPDSMADAIRALFAPGKLITYNSQVLTILASSRQGIVEEPDWNSAPVSVRGFAHSTT